MPFIFVFWICAIALSLAFVGYSFFAENKRRQAMVGLASGLGLAYSETLEPRDQSLFDNFQLASQGRSFGRRASNVIVADSGDMRMVLFDYQYKTSSGKNSHTHRQSVVMVANPSLAVPEFVLSPEGFFNRILAVFGAKDIDFDDDKEFSDRFLLQGSDESRIRSFFDATRRVGFAAHADIHLQCREGGFLYYRPSQRWDAAGVKLAMEKAFQIYQLLQRN